MPDSPTPAQLLGLRDIVVPEQPCPKGIIDCRCDPARTEFYGWALEPPTRIVAIAELEAIVRAKGTWLTVCGPYPDSTWKAAWEIDRKSLAVAHAPTESAARFLALIRAFIALGMVSEEQAGMIEGVRE